MNLKVTVLMSVHNGEKYLREAIESILNQTFKDFEFIIVNDGSADSSKEIIFSYDDPRIVYVENETNIGLTKSLNKGLKLAKGEYIARMDADDISLPERLEKQTNFLNKNQDIALVGSLSQTIDTQGNTLNNNQESLFKEKIYYNLYFGNVFPHSSVMFRKTAVESVGGYDENFRQAQDLDLWSRLSKQFAIGMESSILIKWRNSMNNISSQQQESQRNFADMVFKRTMGELFPKNQKVNSEEIQCFHDINTLGWSKVKINLRKIFLLRKINQQIMQNAPSHINQNELKRVCNRRVMLYLKKRLLEIFFIKSIYDLLRRNLINLKR